VANTPKRRIETTEDPGQGRSERGRPGWNDEGVAEDYPIDPQEGSEADNERAGERLTEQIGPRGYLDLLGEVLNEPSIVGEVEREFLNLWLEAWRSSLEQWLEELAGTIEPRKQEKS
jgi:hypothetical protein